MTAELEAEIIRRRKAEAELAEALRERELIIEAIPDIITFPHEVG